MAPLSSDQNYSISADKINHLAAVGSVAGHWAVMEMHIDVCALQLAGLGNEQVGLCFTAQITGSARKLDAYIAVAKLKGAEKTAAELDKFAKDTARLSEQRNRAVHDPWHIEKDQTPLRIEVTARKKLRLKMVPVSTEELLSLTKSIRAHAERFLKLNEAIKAEIASLPETPQ
jgi:hypothetical protein